MITAGRLPLLRGCWTGAPSSEPPPIPWLVSRTRPRIVVTTRSVLIYLKDKAVALREFYRVLKPGGRVSLFEPINRLSMNPDRFSGYDIRPIAALAAKVQASYDSIEPPDSDPMLDFDDRDLVRCAEDAGFPEVHLDLRVDVPSTVQAMVMTCRRE